MSWTWFTENLDELSLTVAHISELNLSKLCQLNSFDTSNYHQGLLIEEIPNKGFTMTRGINILKCVTLFLYINTRKYIWQSPNSYAFFKREKLKPPPHIAICKSWTCFGTPIPDSLKCWSSWSIIVRLWRLLFESWMTLQV